jgi:hypothetical protein
VDRQAGDPVLSLRRSIETSASLGALHEKDFFFEKHAQSKIVNRNSAFLSRFFLHDQPLWAEKKGFFGS